MGKGKPVCKPIASTGALFIALLLSGQTVAFAYKGGHGPANPAIPNVNLGLAAMPKTGAGVGLPAASAAALKAGPVSIPAGGLKSYLGVGNGVTAQSAAPGASRSASSAGLMPPGHNNPPGVRAGQGYPSNGEAGAGKGGSMPGDDVRSPPTMQGDAGAGSAQASGQGEGQENDTSPGTPVVPLTRAPELLAAAPSSDSSETRPDQLPTCR